jgi:hypothetical protein
MLFTVVILLLQGGVLASPPRLLVALMEHHDPIVHKALLMRQESGIIHEGPHTRPSHAELLAAMLLHSQV